MKMLSSEVKTLLDKLYNLRGEDSVILAKLNKEREAELLLSYIGQVEMLDATNREGHAAKVYFNALFGMDFTRSANIPVNAALNYGYSLILSAFNREITVNGYLTQLGIFHNNMFNHFNLSCDLMEPFRIAVDRVVYSAKPTQFEKEEKHAMWNILDQTVIIDSTHQNRRLNFLILTLMMTDLLLTYEWIQIYENICIF